MFNHHFQGNVRSKRKILTKKVWEYLIRLVDDVITFGAAVAFLKTPSNTLIAKFRKQ